jgi:hypothetical protein
LKKTLGILFVILFFSACKSLHKTKAEKISKIGIEKLIKELNNHRFHAETFVSRISFRYNDASKSLNGSGKIRILKDSIIWGSLNFLGIPMVKFKITPDKVQYYNKINKEYYDGNYKVIKKQFGIDLNFHYLQNLLLGDIIFPVSSSDFSLHHNKTHYLLQTRFPQQIDSIKISPFFKILSEELSYKNHSATIIYSEYKKVKDENIPVKISIKTNNNMNIFITHNNPEVGKKLRFPFSIPENYQPITY